jgi:hypothetical protein
MNESRPTDRVQTPPEERISTERPIAKNTIQSATGELRLLLKRKISLERSTERKEATFLANEVTLREGQAELVSIHLLYGINWKTN